MKRQRLHRFPALQFVLILMTVLGVRAILAASPVVHAVLFYSPTCGHCNYIVDEVFPPLFEEYGDGLQIMGVDATTSSGQRMYQAAVERYAIPVERLGVPTLILGDTVLVGSAEIPAKLHVLIAWNLVQGGVNWPDIPGFAEALRTNGGTPAPTVQSSPLLPDDLTLDNLISRIRGDLAGNVLSILLLVGMLAVMTRVLGCMRRARNERAGMNSFALRGRRCGAVASLCLVGLGVSLYLTYVQLTHTPAICGPIGDCNAVQQSPYVALFGLIPIGVIDALGYAAMLIAWAGTRWARGRFRHLSESALFGTALLGTLFSIYLTFLEPFVIGATCAWCLTSAISMTLILLVVAGSMPMLTGSSRQTARA